MRRRPYFSLGLAACLALAATAQAASSGSVRVTARVLPVARVVGMEQPREVEITAQDVARGYVDLPAATRFVVRANTRFRVRVEAVEAWARAAAVRGLGATLRIAHGAAAGGSVSQAGAFALGYRFELEPGVAPGRYAWPVAISVLPL